MTAPLLVVVTGPPAAGKTAIAETVARSLELPLIAKDAIKERLYDTLGIGDVEWSRRLGRATFEVLFTVVGELLRAGVSVVVEANFSRAGPFSRLPQTRVLQLYVTARPDVLLERYRNRARHPGHPDAELLDEVVARHAAGEWSPLALECELVEVDTTDGVDLERTVDRVRRALAHA